MNAAFTEATILAWLAQGPQTFDALIDRLYDVDENINAFDFIGVMNNLVRAEIVTVDTDDSGTVYRLNK